MVLQVLEINQQKRAFNLTDILPNTKDKKVKFSELSKSGKVVNVYNAMQMAEKVSKSKK